MLFTAEITDFKTVHNVLRAISFKDYVVINPMPEGLKFTLDDVKSLEISAYIPKNMFSLYKIKSTESVFFKISMKAFTECINIFGDEGNPCIKLSYKAVGHPFCLVIKHSDENITVDCELQTMSVDEFCELSLADECNQNKIVMEASILTEILQRMDNFSEEIAIRLTSNPPLLTLTATGVAGESTVNISKQSNSVSLFQCKQDFHAKYVFQNIRQIFKVMNQASQVAISTSDSGLLGIQLVISNDDRHLYVEYFITCLFSCD